MMSTVYQAEDREKRKMYESARIDNIKTHSNFFSSKIADETHLRESRDRNKLHTKFMAQTLYEHVRRYLISKFWLIRLIYICKHYLKVVVSSSTFKFPMQLLNFFPNLLTFSIESKANQQPNYILKASPKGIWI